MEAILRRHLFDDINKFDPQLDEFEEFEPFATGISRRKYQAVLTDEVVAQQDQLNQEVVENLTMAFTRAADNDELNEAITPQDAAIALNALVGGLLSQFLQHPGFISLSKQLDTLLDTLFIGLAKQG